MRNSLKFFWLNVECERKARGLTKGELAKKAGFEATHYAPYLDGREPGFKVIEGIARVLKKDVSELFRDPEFPETDAEAVGKALLGLWSQGVPYDVAQKLMLDLYTKLRKKP